MSFESASPSPSDAPSMDRRVVRSKWRRWLPIAIGVAVLAAAGARLSDRSPAGARAVEASERRSPTVRQGAPSRFRARPRRRGAVAVDLLDAVEGGRVERLAVQDGRDRRRGPTAGRARNPDLEREVGAGEAEISARMGTPEARCCSSSAVAWTATKNSPRPASEALEAEQNLEIRSSAARQGLSSPTADIERVRAAAKFNRDRVRALEASVGPERRLIAESVRGNPPVDRPVGPESAVRARPPGRAELRAPAAGRLTAFDLQLGRPSRPASASARSHRGRPTRSPPKWMNSTSAGSAWTSSELRHTTAPIA